MGLLDGLLGGMMGGGNQNGLMQALMGMLSGGGLQNLLSQFQQHGLEQKAASWVGTGENAALEPHEVEQVLGNSGQLDQIAQQAGVSRQEAAGGLAQLLPNLINGLTPQGQVPQGGVQQNDLMGMLGGLLGGGQGQTPGR